MIQNWLELLQPLTSRIEGPAARRLVKGVSWSVAGGVISSASTLVASVFVARLLGPAEYGALGIIQSTLATFIVFAGPALGLTATKYIAELRESDPERAARILRLNNTVAFLLGGVLALVVFVAAPYLASKTLAAPYLVIPLQMAAPALFLTSINSAQIGTLAGFEAFGRIAKINLLRGIVIFPVMWYLTMHYGLGGAVVSLSIVAAIGCLASSWSLRRETRRAKFPFSNQGYWSEARLLITFSLPAMLSALMYLAPSWLANVILVREPNGYVEMGVFNAANQWRSAILFLPSVVTPTFLSILANLAGTGRMAQYRKVFLASVVGITLVALAPASVIAIASGQIMGAYGTGFSHGALVLVLIAIATALAAPCMAILQSITSIGNLWSSVVMIGVWGAIFLVSVLFFKRLGAEGLAIAYMIAYAVQLILFASYTYFVLKPAMSKVPTAHREVGVSFDLPT
jgi:O-antigen/teichoic acid export membrane protein